MMAKSDSERYDFPVFDRDKFQNYRFLIQNIMQLALQGLLRMDFLDEVAKTLIDFSGCDSVELWLKERGRYYSGKVNRSHKNKFIFKIMPTVTNRDGHIIPQVRERHLPECLLRDILEKRLDLYPGFLSKKGSFWTGDMNSTFSQIAKKLRIRNISQAVQTGGFQSLAVIPIPVEDETIGLLQLKSKASNKMRLQDIEFYESIVETLGIALIHRRTQVELRERIKEFTCLYDIAKLAENTEVSLHELLRRVVELLPPAWLYPEIASARIVLDGRSYATSCFHGSDQKLVAHIVVNGENRGMVEVNYSDEKPELDEGPFLREERNLIDTIAREISLIIERKQTEVEKVRLQDQLRHADRLATIGQLSAGIAHELNEPIGSILGFSQLIKKNPGLPKQAQFDIEKIMKASLHAREVIKKLMLFARQMPPQKTMVNLNKIIDEGLYFLEARCAKEKIEVNRILQKDLPAIHADPAQMTQILVNIVVNAIQAMPGGGVLTIRTSSSKKFVSLLIKDTGVGMKKKIRQKVFLPFFTTKDVREGTGLGLAVVHGIVTSHGGSISVDSEVGKGTIFEIKLPRKETSARKE